ncbi:MAG: hypothetical protein MJ124_07700 [Lachnospiraceae bacterium]|nr:hypothetical protein [Lachnospiraceae bacterium]
METAKNILLFSVGIILTVGFVAIGMTIFNKSKTSISNTNAQYDSLVSQYSDIEYALYENTGSTASGSEVRKLIKGLKEDDNIKIYVKNGAYKQNHTEDANQTGILFSYGAKTIEEMDNKTKDSGDNYINPMASFSCELKRNSNGCIESLTFTQK